jgi:transcriptional regulator with XRE-family HTH domain
MSKAKTTTKNFGDYLRNRINGDSELKEMVEEESVYAQIATQIYDLRKRKGLTQAQLAELVGTTQSVIARMENSDYTGHSISMLTRIASSCGAKFRAEFRMGTQPLVGPTPVAKARPKAHPKEKASSQTKVKSSKGKRG